MKNFDIIVIGSGAGLMVAQAAYTYGMKCAIIEKDKFGGTCLTRGCIPSKILVYPADLIREFQKANRVGLNFNAPKVDWQNISKRMWEQIDYSNQMEESLKQIDDFSVYKGTAEFVDKKTLKVKYTDGTFSQNISGDIIIIANGARPNIPPIPNIKKTGYITYESFFGDKFPQKPWDGLTIVGGGAIGMEFAHIFSAFGTKVNVIEMMPHIMATEEEEISKFAQKNFEQNSVSIYTNSKIIDSWEDNGKKSIKIENMATGDISIVKSEEIFLASGVRSNSDTLKLEHTDIKCDARGYIITDKFLQTTQKDVYAIGDINGKHQFRHTANYEAEILIQNLFTKRDKKMVSYNSVPSAIFTSPQIAHVGMTEKQARESGKKYWIGKNYYSQVAAGISMGIKNNSLDNGFVKIIVGEEQSILGVHVAGPHASILLQPFVYLMNTGYKCNKKRFNRSASDDCKPLGSFIAVNDSMVIRPSLNELTAWVIENIDWDSN